MDEYGVLSNLCREDKTTIDMYPCLGNCNTCLWKEHLISELRRQGWKSPTEVTELIEKQNKTYKTEMREAAMYERNLNRIRWHYL